MISVAAERICLRVARSVPSRAVIAAPSTPIGSSAVTGAGAGPMSDSAVPLISACRAKV